MAWNNKIRLIEKRKEKISKAIVYSCSNVFKIPQNSQKQTALAKLRPAEYVTFTLHTFFVVIIWKIRSSYFSKL